MRPLDEQDFLILHLALDMLSTHTDNELTQARKKGNSAKQMTMITMRQRIVVVRAKVSALEVPT